MTASASDNVSVASVQFQLDGASLGAPVTASPYASSWDTTATTGGSHTLTALATDAAGNTTTSTAVTVTVDNTPPTVAITAPANGADVGRTVNVTANASDNVSVASVLFQLDGVNLGAPVTASPYTFSWNTTTATGGTHTLTAVASDAAGNTTTSTAVTVTVDNTPPTVAITAPANGAYLAGTVSVSANASDNVSVASVQFQLDGANLGAPVTTAPYTISWNTTTATGGGHSLTAIATDAAGNTTTSTAVTVTVDNTPPTVAITAPASGSISGTVNVTASASDNVGVTSVQFKLDGANLGAPVTAAPYTVSWNTITAVGSHSLTAVASDAAGNTTTSTPLSVTVLDVTPPTVSITSPAGGYTAGTVNVTASASDNVAVATVQFKLDGANLGAAVTTAPYTYSWNTITYIGNHTLTAVATDTAGNTATSAAGGVSVADITPPTVTVTAPAASATVSGSVTLSASASDNVGVTEVVFQVDGSEVGYTTTTPFRYSWNSASVTPGNHTVTAVAYDAADNFTTSAGVSIKVVPGTPALSVTSGGVTSSTSLTVEPQHYLYVQLDSAYRCDNEVCHTAGSG